MSVVMFRIVTSMEDVEDYYSIHDISYRQSSIITFGIANDSVVVI